MRSYPQPTRTVWQKARLDPKLFLRASIRAKVEHPFHVVKNLFHHRKTRYRGLAKNAAQLFSLFGLANLMLARRWLLNPRGQVAS
jgi:IS5 family transposase